MADVAILDIADEQHTTRDLCKIPYPIQEEGSACLGRRKRMAVQNAIAQNKKPKFQSFERLKAPAGGGQAGATRRCHCVRHDCWVCALCRGLL